MEHPYYRPEEVASFYDAYSHHEWDRLETAYGRLQAIIHTDMLRRHVRVPSRALDAGSGPGRFSVELARLGAGVTVLDVSSVQLRLAREQLEEANLLERAEEFAQADIVDLGRFADGSFEVTVCYGGALSYVGDRRFDAARELRRVTKPGGLLLLSVMSRYGATANLVRRAVTDFMKGAWEPLVWHVLETGDLSGIPSTRVVGQLHPAMHLYTSEELVDLFSGCEILEVAGSNVVAAEGAPALEDVAADPDAWATAVELERRMCTNPGLVDGGSHIILVARLPASG